MSRALHNSRLLALAVALLLVAGLAAFATLPRTEDPRVLNRVATVLAPFPGASAERVEALVAEPIENALRELPEVQTLESRSQPGLAVVTLELKDSVTDTVPVWSRARDKLNDLLPALPAGVQPQFNDERGYAYTLLVALTWSGPGEVDLAVLGRYAEELQSRLRALNGTDLVSLYGVAEEELLVAIDPARLSALQLTPETVAAALAGTDAKVAAGTLHPERHRLLVEVASELDSLERIRRTPLTVTADGRTVRLGDVAEVSRQLRQPPSERVLLHDQPGVVIAARMLPDLRIDQWRGWAQEQLELFTQTLPGNIRLAVIFDQNRYTQIRLSSLLSNILQGFGLIAAVLLITLGWRAALITATALPLTVLFTLACMKMIGLPIHQMSVTGLVVALGIMVDNAIIMTDGIGQRRRQGLSAVAAVSDALHHLWLPLLGSTLTTILAFAPIALMPGPAGEFVGGIALAVIWALIGSYLVSFTLVAGLAGRWLRAGQGRWRWLDEGIHLPRLGRGFAATLRVAVAYPRLTIVAALLLPLAGFIGAGRLTEQFFPPSDRDMFSLELLLPASTSLAETERTARHLSRLFAEYPEIESAHWFIGHSAPPFYYNLMQDKDGRQNFAQAMLKVQDAPTANRLIPLLQSRLDDALPGAQILVRKLEQGPPFNAPIEVRVVGPNLDVLRALGDELRALLLATPDVIHTRATLAGGAPKLELQVDEEAARLAGVSPVQLAAQLNATLDGTRGGSVLEGVEEVPVRIRVEGPTRREAADLAALTVASTTAGQTGAPLAALGRLELTAALATIPRRNGERVTTVEGYLRAGVLPQTALDDFRQRLAQAELPLPAGYRLEFGGEAAERNNAVGNLLANVGVVVALLIAVVVLSFNSFRLGGVIMAVAVQAAGLGLLCVYLSGYPFGFTVIVGLLGLIGLAINAAIVILAELRSDPAAARGERAAMVGVVMQTSRHIVSTTITTVGGFLPLILAGGGFWPPFAVAIAGGTVLTTLLSFYFAPACFALYAGRPAQQQVLSDSEFSGRAACQSL